MSDELKTEFQYVLKSPFSYASKGETIEAKFVVLTAPTSRTTHECAALKQAFFRAMGEQDSTTATGAEQASDYTIEGPDIMTLLAMSKNVDFPDVLEVAKRLFQMPGIALVDGETKFGSALIDRMSIDDLEDMLGQYMVNFILASSLKRLQDKSTKVSQT